MRFTEWTSDGVLRQPVYLGMRTTRRRGPCGARSEKPAAQKPGADPRRPSVEDENGWTEKSERTEVRPQHLVQSSTGSLSSRREADGDLALPNGDMLRVTNLAKVFWPELRITKGDLLRYYVEVSPFLLPAVDDRPLVMKRFPNGVDKPAFYQQRHPEAVPPGVRREVLPDARRADRRGRAARSAHRRIADDARCT